MLNAAMVFLVQDIAKQSFHESKLRYIYDDLGFDSNNALLSPLKMAGCRRQKKVP